MQTPLAKTSSTGLTPVITGQEAQPFVKATPIRWRDYVPQRPLFPDQESELDFYARSPFTAWEHALVRKEPHPKLWRAVKGSPYEALYVRLYGKPNEN